MNYDYLFKPNSRKSLIVHKKLDQNIAIIKLFPGISSAILQSILNTDGLKGVILETYGAGNCTTENWFIDILKEAIKKGIHIVNVTQCSGGSVSMGQYETSSRLKKIGIISGKNSTTEAAVSKLMYLLGQNISTNLFKTIYETPLRGEMN